MLERGKTLWLCLWFDQLALDALINDAQAPASVIPGSAASAAASNADSYDPFPRHRPIAVLEKQRVVVANDAAAALGVVPGMGTATARALADDIRLLERNPDAEQRCLHRLCCWAYSVSPTLYPLREHSLMLEVGSCLRLYGSLEALLTRVRRALAQRDYHYRYGLGPTPKSAELFAIRPLEVNAAALNQEALHHQPSASGETLESDSVVLDREAPGHRRGASHDFSDPSNTPLEDQLAPLPLKLLVDFPREVDALARAGLWRFADILAMPKQALARRCGVDFVHNLNQILGTAEDIGETFEPPQTFVDHHWFGYEVKANQELLPAAELLIKALCQFLRNTQLHTQELHWLLYGINRQVHNFSVCSSQPHTDWKAWYQLTRLKVDQVNLDQSIEGVGLECHDLMPGQHHAEDLFQQAGQKEPLHCLLDRLKSRLGLQSVSTIACRDEHLPEFAGYCSLDSRPATMPADDRGVLRPFWLMQEPTRLKEHGGAPCWNGRLMLLDGPERIEDNWWEQAVSRDYYIARDGSGQQYWIYHDRLQNGWYLQGVFS